jgi:hypothetical protein
MTSPLAHYRDDGPVAAWVGRTVGRALHVGEVQLTLLGAGVAVALLVVPARSLTPAVAALATVVFVLAGGAASGQARPSRLAWTVPPLLRGLEYALLIKLTVVADPDALPRCYALLCALAFHHYDIVYRLRQQGIAPPAWVRAAGGGWDGRLLLAAVLTVTGGLGVALLAAAAALAALYGTESIVSWRAFITAQRPDGSGAQNGGTR